MNLINMCYFRLRNLKSIKKSNFQLIKLSVLSPGDYCIFDCLLVLSYSFLSIPGIRFYLCSCLLLKLCIISWWISGGQNLRMGKIVNWRLWINYVILRVEKHIPQSISIPENSLQDGILGIIMLSPSQFWGLPGISKIVKWVDFEY